MSFVVTLRASRLCLTSIHLHLCHSVGHQFDSVTFVKSWLTSNRRSAVCSQGPASKQNETAGIAVECLWHCGIWCKRASSSRPQVVGLLCESIVLDFVYVCVTDYSVNMYIFLILTTCKNITKLSLNKLCSAVIYLIQQRDWN